MQIGRNKLKLCKYGWMLFHGPYIGTCFDLYGQYSEAEVKMMSYFLRPGDVCIDVGGNIGDLTLPMARLVGPTGRVFAVESHPESFNILCANMALNGINHVVPLNYFVADSADVDTSGPWGQFGYVSDKIETKFMKLDALSLTACALIKIDVDGKELEVLKSARQTIATCRPALYFENDIPEISKELLEYVLALEYVIYFHPAPIFEPDNFFGNPNNHWAGNILSLMMLAIPKERAETYKVSLRQVISADEWWQNGSPPPGGATTASGATTAGDSPA